MADSLFRFFWALVAFVLVASAGLLWIGLVRRDVFRKTAEVRRRESAIENYYQDLFENSHDIIFTLDLQGSFLSLNRAGEAAFGFPAAHLAKRDFKHLAQPKSAASAKAALESFRGGQNRLRTELEFTDARGKRVVLDLHFHIQHRDGHPFQIQVMGWDITQRREAEEALQESEHRLRHALDERERLGRDLHDGIIQSLYAVGLGLQESRAHCRSDEARTEQRLGAAVQDINQVIREVRGFIGGLAPEALPPERFKQLLENQIRSAGADLAARYAVDVQPEAVSELGQQRAAGVLQIAREALSNSLRHAQAHHGLVKLAISGQTVCLEISDDGEGTSIPLTASNDTGGLGLKNMAARALELGATLTILQPPDYAGTKVSIELPCRISSPNPSPAIGPR